MIPQILTMIPGFGRSEGRDEIYPESPWSNQHFDSTKNGRLKKKKTIMNHSVNYI